MLKLKNISPFNIILFFLLLIAIIRIIYYFQKDYPITNSNINNTFLITDYQIKDKTITLTLKNHQKYLAKYYLKDNESIPQIQIGNYLTIEGKLSLPNTNDLPNTFNYQNYLNSQNIHYQITIQKWQISSQKIPILYQIKNYLHRHNTSYTNEYINALILSDDSLISSNVQDSYQINGISHLLAISGMHISLLCALITKFLHHIKITKTNLIITIFLIFYLFLTDFSPSITRASTFLILNIFLKKKLKSSTTKILILSYLIDLILFPYFLINLSFLYSSIITFFLCKYSLNIQNYFKATLAISLVAFFAALPITINSYHQINLLSPFLNILFVPMLTFVIYPLTLISFFIPIFSYILDPLILLFQNLSIFFSHFTHLIIPIPHISPIFIIVYYSILLLSKRFKIKLIIKLSCLIIFIKFLPFLDYHGYIYYLSVGQGDSALIISPYQKDIILIDSGGSANNSNTNSYLASNIAAFLKSLGINHLDALIISHGDSDHLASSIYLSNLLSINHLILNQGSLTDLERILQNQITTTPYNPHNLQLQTLNHQEYSNENDNSQVNLLAIYHSSFLFTGDITNKVEQELLTKYQFPPISIIKLAHHGSDTSNSFSFLNTINPSYAIISSGLNNRYHHPSPKTIDTLNQLSIPYYNTAYNKTIKVKISPKNITIYPMIT